MSEQLSLFEVEPTARTIRAVSAPRETRPLAWLTARELKQQLAIAHRVGLRGRKFQILAEAKRRGIRL